MNRQNIAQISNLEEKILNELQKNCRLNLDEIGKKCGCSRYKVARVMKKFEENKTILGYSAIINPKKMNLKHYILLIKRTSIPVEEDYLKKLPISDLTDLFPGTKINVKFENTCYIHGKYDWMTTFITDDISNAKEFCRQILKDFHKYVDNVELVETVLPIRMCGFRIPQNKQILDIL
jgi:DNA-binding Lrp family transcriptional regulator